MNATAVLHERSVICTLENADVLADVGNKAYNLGRMVRLGFNVPTGFVITNKAFDSFCQANGINVGFAQETRPDVHSASIPRMIIDEVLQLRAVHLPPGPVAIRSSAVGEDGAGSSFAGQLDSILHVQTDDEVERALLACWASYWNERLLSYQRGRGVQLRGMGVIVQAQVRSRVSGVLFTESSALEATQQQISVEYCAGFGDALVSGRVSPGRFRIGKTDGRYIVDEILPEQDSRTAQLLFTAPQIAKLAHAAADLESHFGCPQDVEWTIDDSGDLFLLQSRPITARASAPSSQILWSNANVNENFPGPITPFLYSIAREGYYHYFRNLAEAFGLSTARVRRMEDPLRHLVGVHHARIYYNLTNIHSVLRMAPFGERLAEFFNNFVGADAMAPAKPAPARSPSPWFQLLELCRIFTKTSWHHAFLTRRVEEFERSADSWARTTAPSDLDGRPLLALRDDLRGFMNIRCHQWTNASLADAASMICYGVLKLLLRTAYPASSQSALHNNLLKGLGGIVSVQPAVELWQLSRKILTDPETAQWFAGTASCDIWRALEAEPRRQWLREELNGYLERWGFRFSGELMLTVPSFQEDPAPLFDMLKTYLKADGTPVIDAASTAHVLEDLRRTKRIRLIPRRLQAPVVGFALRATRRAIRLRERARSKQALLYNRCRRIALAIGKTLVADGTCEKADDVFFLTYQELDEFLSGHAMFPGALAETIALRRRAHELAGNFVALDTFTLREGAYLRRGDEGLDSSSLDSTLDMTGISACGGMVTARAAVLESVADAHMLRIGDILVTRQTDPGWAPVFSLIRGLVIERGGMLSHGAIIAREFGLPCVVGVKGATARIPQGCLLSIDGDQGHVRILD
ncbi:MAG TPA: PEP/pyruvate-binding domain-containing protein [Terriglobia bacterium]|nr:PEP/pyruvate-binding domain-containing protein [Terriglobia bacterium]